MAKYKASSFQTGYVQRTALDPSKKDYAKAKQLAASAQEEVKKLANMQKSVEAQTAHYFKGLTGIDSYELASYSKTMGAVQDFLGSTLTTIGKNMINELENEKTIRSGLEHQADMFDDVLNNYEYNPIMQEEISGALYDDKRVYMIEESSNDINDILIDYMAESINYSAFRTLIEDINDKYGVYDISYKIPPKKDMHKVSATTLLKESKNKEAN